MTVRSRTLISFALMAGLLLAVALGQSWSVALAIFNLCLISAVMALGVNIQWGYAGLFNVGIMGFAALGGVSAVLVSKAPVVEAWSVGGGGLFVSFVCVALTITAAIFTYRKLHPGRKRALYISLIIIIGYFVTRYVADPAIGAIESVDAARTGYLGGMGLPIVFSWIVGGLFAAGAAWIVGKVALGLRSDYLAIATLGISEIIIAILKNEDWLTRGVKNVSGLPRPVPYEIELQHSDWFLRLVERLNSDMLSTLTSTDKADALQKLVIEYSGIFVKLCYAGLFASVLIVILILSAKALNSPWGRMMRAIRDNEVSASAMGKDITARHLQVFVLGSAVVGVAGAMLTTLDGQFTPGTYNPLRFTFLIWVMVIVGGSGNNLGAVLGGFVIWFFWIEAEPMGLWLVDALTSGFGDTSFIRTHMMENAQHMRLFVMGLVLLLVMRFSPGGILPEVIRRPKKNV
ncbi:MAG: branched-chain amino acid ABC transporter permease [Gammaproteobacteria bacterium]|nr:branched-chain amino acid ABC transporter permease [Gammaproteobacteria bacterium]